MPLGAYDLLELDGEDLRNLLLGSARTAGAASRAAPPASFGISLRSQPINATASLQPIIYLRLAPKALNVAELGARIVSLNLPLVVGDALVFEFDAGFAHVAVMAAFGRRGQRCCLRARADVQQEPK